LAILPIRLYPDPVLRARCREVTAFDDRLRKLASDMVETTHAAPGVGLAAPQVGVELRLAVVDVSVGQDPSQLHVLVNPEIVRQEGLITEVEGCLSIPGINDKVDRPEKVAVRALDVEGRPCEIEGEGWFARALCHEIDHLNGVLFIDHLRGLRRERVRRQLRKLAVEYDEVRAGVGA
jgi:peptide deformylase